MYTTYPQPQNYGPQHNGYGYAPMPQQPMPMAAPVAASSSTNSALLMVAGLAVVGAAAFGGVYLMNTSHAEPTAASTPSTVVNIPSTIEIPSLTTDQDDPAVIRQGDGTTGSPGGRDHLFGSGCMVWRFRGGVN